MKTSIQTDYHATIMVNVPPLQATEAINQVKLWWTENTEGSTNKLNDLFKVTFGETFSRFKITEMIPGEKINWLVLDCNLHWMNNKKEWKDMNILWEISSSNNSTRIDMTHIGLGPGIECFEDCTKGWNHYVKESLYKLIMEGKGVPDHRDYSALYRQ
jgi:hypothetical protein